MKSTKTRIMCRHALTDFKLTHKAHVQYINVFLFQTILYCSAIKIVGLKPRKGKDTRRKPNVNKLVYYPYLSSVKDHKVCKTDLQYI